MAALLATAGGVTANGTLKNVIIFHKGETRYEDILAGSKTGPTTGPSLGEGDVVYVQDNVNAFYVFGSAERKGRYFMRDSRKYTLTDAVAEAGGASAEGSLSHVVLVRRNAEGKMVGTEFRLDKFIRDGDEASNPQVLPGDIVFVGRPVGLSWNTFLQTVSSALFLQTLVRR